MIRLAALALVIGCGAADRPTDPPGRVATTAGSAAGSAAGGSAAAGSAAGSPVSIGSPVWKRGTLSGSESMCAVRGDGHVLCWGSNSYGEVGGAARTAHPVPIVVPGIEHAIAVGSGPGASCAIVAGGHVRCWGSYEPKAQAMRDVAGLDRAVELAVMSLNACARRDDGTVWCWSLSEPTAPKATVETALDRGRELVSGHSYACVLGLDGGVRCMLWFQSAAGKPTYAEQDIVDARGAVQLATYFETTCAVMPAGTVTCWSIEDSRGQSSLDLYEIPGLDDAIDLTPGSDMCVAKRAGGAVCFFGGRQVTLRPADELRKFSSIAGATSARCGIRAGSDEIACWGNDYGPIGRHGRSNARGTPIDVPRIADATGIAVEDEQTCALRKAGTVACWRELSSKVRPAAVDKLPAADHLWSGSDFMCATHGAEARCWGTESWHDCRWDSPDNCQYVRLPEPTKVPGLLGLKGAVEISARCALMAGGGVKCLRDDFRDIHPVDVPVAHAKSVSRRCAVDDSGGVSCWKLRDDDKAAVIAIAGLAPAAQVVSGAEHDCALLRDGQVACWGSNGSGQLGDASHKPRTTPAPVVGLTDVVQLAAGEAFTCARTKAGAIWCWGSNDGGALGDGSGRDQAAPVAVVGLADAVELRASRQRVCALRKGGKVACWGHHAGDRVDDITIEQALPIAEPDTLDE